MKYQLLTCYALVLLASCGCDQDTHVHDAYVSGNGVPVPASEPQESVSVEVASWDDVQAMVAAHKGKVVVIDIWSTSCIPCMREFPNLVKLHQEHGEDVACISVDVDYYGGGDSPEEYREPVLEMLQKWDATFQNVISSDADTELYAKLGGELSVPIIMVYGRDGQLAKRFDHSSDEFGEEGFTYPDHIVPLVEELIAGGGQ